MSRFLRNLVTYHLVDLRDLRLEDGDGISDRGFFAGVSHSGGPEGLRGKSSELLVLTHAGSKFRKHPLIIINIANSGN